LQERGFVEFAHQVRKGDCGKSLADLPGLRAEQDECQEDAKTNV
jgi:hypothetical protein